MNENSIKNTWDNYVADLPIEPEDLYGMVQKVLYELATAASSEDSERDFDENSRSLILPNGLTITLDEPGPPEDDSFTVRFSISIARDETKKTMRFQATTGTNQLKTVSSMDDPKNNSVWTKPKGPEKAWMLDNLRTHVVDFIKTAKK